MIEEERFSGYSRPDLIRYVLRKTVAIPDEKMSQIDEMRRWCRDRFGEERPGSILFEAMEGWLDYFDGEWSDFSNDFESDDYLFWFERDQDRMLFALTWL